MNTKLRTVLAGVTAAAVLAGGIFAASSASADPWQHHNDRHYDHYGHYGYYDDGVGAGILGFIAGAFVGNALSHSYDDNSCYRFRTYDPQTGMYMSYNGPRHCP